MDGEDLAAALMDAGLAWAFVEYSDLFVAREAAVASRGIGILAGPSWPVAAKLQVSRTPREVVE